MKKVGESTVKMMRSLGFSKATMTRPLSFQSQPWEESLVRFNQSQKLYGLHDTQNFI
jgi:hypothetical protein